MALAPNIMDESNPFAQRIMELEAKIALSEDAIEALNRTVYRQQEQLDRLQEELRALQAVPQSGGDSAAETGVEIPPHY